MARYFINSQIKQSDISRYTLYIIQLCFATSLPMLFTTHVLRNVDIAKRLYDSLLRYKYTPHI